MAGKPGVFSRRVIRAACIVAVVALAWALLVLDGRVLLLLLSGTLFGVSLRGSGAWIARRTHVPYGVVLVAMVVVTIGGLVLGCYSFLAQAIDQARALQDEIPKAWQSLVASLHNQPALQRLAESSSPSLPRTLEPGKLVGGATAAVGGITEAVGAIVVVVFLGVYGAAQPDAYARVALQLVPARHRDRVATVLAEIAHQLGRWMLGRVVAMVFVGVVATVGLVLLKVPLALPLGILAGLLTFVEYLGAIASAAPACLLAFTTGPSHVLGVVILYVCAHLVEGYGLTPVLAKRTVAFPPAYTLAAQLILGSIFGVAGLTLATPVVIVLSVPVRRLYVEGVLGSAATPRVSAPTRAPVGSAAAAGPL
jgi:predicted PurR-regulated permease PerM